MEKDDTNVIFFGRGWRWGVWVSIKWCCRRLLPDVHALCPFARLTSNDVEPNPQCQHAGLPCVFLLPSHLHFPSFPHYRGPFFQRPPAHPLSSRGAWLRGTGGVAGAPTHLIDTERVIARKEEVKPRGVHLGSGHRCALLITSDFG